MRGRPVHGFRLTRQRIERGVTSAELMAKLQEINDARKQGKKLSPSLIAADRQIQKNIKLVRTKKLLSSNIEGLHPVEKSALRREALRII